MQLGKTVSAIRFKIALKSYFIAGPPHGNPQEESKDDGYFAVKSKSFTYTCKSHLSGHWPSPHKRYMSLYSQTEFVVYIPSCRFNSLSYMLWVKIMWPC